MSFETGTAGFRMLLMPRKLPDDYIDRFRQHAAPPLSAEAEGRISGWVTGRHLLDRDIRGETAVFAGYCRLALLEAERKVPASLLKAEARMEELAVLEAEGRDFLNRKERSQIRKQVEERLKPQMPPQLKAHPFVADPGQTMTYSGALSDKSSDLLCARLMSTLGFQVLPLTPDLAAMHRMNADCRQWHPASFSAEVPDSTMEVHPGREFLTWLWFMAETEQGGRLSLADERFVDVLVEGPLTFAHEGQGAFETILRRGEPIISAEAKTALRTGKKLRMAKLTLAQGEEIWTCMFDADAFIVRSLKLPESDELLDAASRFQERMMLMDRFRDMLLDLYDSYVKVRINPPGWKQTREAMQAWVKERKARM